MAIAARRSLAPPRAPAVRRTSEFMQTELDAMSKQDMKGFRVQGSGRTHRRRRIRQAAESWNL